MNFNFRSGYGRWLPSVRSAGLICLSAVAVSLAGCGGDSSNNNTATDYGNNFESAFAVVGQASLGSTSTTQSDQGTISPNRGGAVSALGLSSPASSIATNGTLFYVGDSGNNRILGYTSIPTALNTPATFVLGQPNLTSSSPTTTTTGLAQPSKVSISNNGIGSQLVVADSNNNRVLIWNTLPTTTGTPPDVILGQGATTPAGDGTTNTAGTSSTTFSFPSGAMIGNGKLVVVDEGNNRVLIWNKVPTADGTPADVVLGQADFNSKVAGYYDNTNNLGLTQLTGPSDVWTDGFKLLVSDTGNNRVLYWRQIPGTTNTPADIIIGQTSTTRTAAGTSSTLFTAPIGVGSDGTQLYIADSGNNRVLVYSSFPVTTGTAAYRVIGQGDFTHSQFNDSFNNSNGNDNQDGVTDYANARTLHTPAAVVAGNGTIYVTDRDNNRVLFYTQ